MTQAVPQADAERLLAVRQATLRLLEYCRSHDWVGYDPYDALNSKVVQRLPMLQIRAVRLILTQLLKRSPVNLRPLLLVPYSQNPKGLALFIPALLRLARLQLVPSDTSRDLVSRLLALRSPGTAHWCWGYPFPWQSRAALFPRWLPNVICTSFAGNALLDVYKEFSDPDCLKIAVSAADFLLETLYYEEPCSVACFSYTPVARSKVHNANLLGAAFLCRAGKASGEERFFFPAIKAARFSVAHQHPDGSWDYGDSDTPPQRWKDNFHTGFNLTALRSIAQNAGTDEFESATMRGFQFFRENFFEPDGRARYFHNRTYPVDIHSAAQSIIVLMSFKDLDPASIKLAQSVCHWTLHNLCAAEGFFFFQKQRFYTNKIPYMRWSQAWMLLALSVLLEHGLQAPRERKGAQ